MPINVTPEDISDIEKHPFPFVYGNNFEVSFSNNLNKDIEQITIDNFPPNYQGEITVYYTDINDNVKVSISEESNYVFVENENGNIISTNIILSPAAIGLKVDHIQNNIYISFNFANKAFINMEDSAV